MEKDSFQEWRDVCINFNPDQKWLVSEVILSRYDKGVPVTKAESVTVKSLWDTGSTITIICPEIAKYLKLKSEGKEKMTHLKGHGQVNTYRVNLVIGGYIAIQNMKVVEMPCRNANFDMIIGIDVIKLGTFSLDHGRNMKFTVTNYETLD